MKQAGELILFVFAGF